MAKLRAFSVPPEHADAALARTHHAGDAALLFDPALAPALRAELCATFAASSLTLVDNDGSARTENFTDGAILDDAAALVVLTSGSTGDPKGVELSHPALDTAVRASLARLKLTTADTVIQALPTHHIAGLLGVLRARALGANLVTVNSTDALSSLTSDLTALVPTQLARLLALHADVSQLGMILLGGAAANTKLLCDARLQGATLVTSYGMSETCGGCVYDGVPLDNTTVAIEGPDDTCGQILIRSAQLFDGYRIGRKLLRHDPNNWFITSDHGVWKDGVLEVTGRIDQTVVSGGENIPLMAVQQALEATPDITDVFVLSRASKTWGEEVIALIVGDTTIDAVKTHLRAVLPPHWVPRQIKAVATLPKTALGKPDRAAAQALFD
ncbi:MAG: AMP-binding protein [Nitriliruptoraceae bacterium]